MKNLQQYILNKIISDLQETLDPKMSPRIADERVSKIVEVLKDYCFIFFNK